MMKRKALLAACFLLAFLVAAKPYSTEEKFFRDIPSKKPVVETPTHVPELYIFRRSKGAVPVHYTYPVKKINGDWALAYKDFIRLVGEKRMGYFPEEKIITINQINRIYMAADKAVVVRPSGRAEAASYPTFDGDALYVPLVFTLKEMGYGINLSDDGSRLLILPPEDQAKVVPDRAVKVGSISPYRDGTMATEIYDISTTQIRGWGEKVPGGMGSFFQINEKQSIRFIGDLALDAPAYYDDETKSALAVDGQRLVIYSLDKMTRKSYPLPYAMEGAERICYDRGHVYFQRPGGIYAYSPKSKVLKRVVDRDTEDFDVQDGRIIYRRGGVLFIHEDDREDRPLDSKAAHFSLSASYILLDDGDLGLVTILDRDTLQAVSFAAYDKNKGHSVKLMGDRYLAFGQGRLVQLKDLDSDATYLLDMVNIEDTLKGRRVLWLYNGSVLKGYVYGDGRKIAQTITVHP